MKKKILIVEDQFVEADYLRMLLVKAGYSLCEIARSVIEAQEIIKLEKPALVLLDIYLKGRLTGIDLAKQLKEECITFIYLSANSNEEILTAAKATEPYGFLVKPFREKDLMIALEIAFYRHEQSNEAGWRLEMNVQKALNDIMGMESSWTKKLLLMARALQQLIPFDCLAVSFHSVEHIQAPQWLFQRTGFDEYQTIGMDELSTISGIKIHDIDLLMKNTPATHTAGFYNGDEFSALFPLNPMKAFIARTFGFCSNIVFPFLSQEQHSVTLNFFRKLPDGYSTDKLNSLFRLQQPMSLIINSISQVRKSEAVASRYRSTQFVQIPSRTKPHFCDIIGNSSSILNVLDLVYQVASSDTSVLILGESGTGKEKIADCIHASSSRRDQPMIKVNCAALPPSLIESELFGHEKGAFTGATDKRIGKFEQADRGTIFLDEIGELPLELQVKLLRVLQEKEVERVGSRYVLKINVRIIAATNRNLEKEVAEGRFRLDLYYRLNVFPISLPPLRERIEDIPILVDHFLRYFSLKTGKKVTGISEKIEKKFKEYQWPGNIRELEHMIERSVLLAKTSVIEDVQLPVFQKREEHTNETGYIKTIEENERDHILRVLKKCNGKIWGNGGAAEVLNIPPSTLKSKMNKLGIRKAFSE
jgi:DNA-binding NtrC family response regulator